VHSTLLINNNDNYFNLDAVYEIIYKFNPYNVTLRLNWQVNWCNTFNFFLSTDVRLCSAKRILFTRVVRQYRFSYSLSQRQRNKRLKRKYISNKIFIFSQRNWAVKFFKKFFIFFILPPTSLWISQRYFYISSNKVSFLDLA
jgi:hypothetical protein